MDQTNFEGLLKNFQAQCSPDSPIADLSATPGAATSPIVVLVHGIGGNAHHWADPTSLNPNDTWLFDLKSSPNHAQSGVRTSPPYNAGTVKAWAQLLSDNNITHINFSQVVQDGDLIQYPVQQLVAILDTLEKTVFQPYEADVAANGGTVPPLIVLCHSRGGLVTRLATKQLGNAGLPHLRKIITLCTPHHGSYMPKLANDYNTTLHSNLDFTSFESKLPGPIRGFLSHTLDKYINDLANMVRQALLHSFGTMATSPGFGELIPGSSMLQGLEQGEQPLAGVTYHGFSGTDPTFLNLFLCEMGQTFHLMGVSSPPLIQMLSRIPGVLQGYGNLAEIDKGDSAVSLTSSYWPTAFGASHQEFNLNHMQALVDPPLQGAVLPLLK